MIRTTISLPEKLLERLRAVSAAEGMSIAALVRESVTERLRRHRPSPESLGAGASGRRDVGERAGELRPVERSWR